MRHIMFAAGILLPGLVLTGTAQEQNKQHEHHKQHAEDHGHHKSHEMHGRPDHGHQWSAEEWVQRLESPDRAEWQKPDEVVKALGLQEGVVVADIGAGSGYFSARFAKALRGSGKVLAVDIEEGLVKHLQKRAAHENLKNMEAVQAAPDDPNLPAGSIDVIFVCDVLHHVEDRPNYYKKLAASLRPGGRFAVVDFYKRESPVGPGIEMKISREAMVAEITDAGFRLKEEFDFLPHQYFLVFEASGK